MSATVPVQRIMRMLEAAGADLTHAEFRANPGDDTLEIALATGAFIVAGETEVTQHGVTYSYWMATLYEAREDIGRSVGQLIWDGAGVGLPALIDAIYSYFPQVG